MNGADKKQREFGLDSGKIAFPGEKQITDESPRMEEVDENDLDYDSGAEISDDLTPRSPSPENLLNERGKSK